MSSFDERLIEAVRCYEHLYAPGHKQYYDSSMKDNAWKEIAEKLGSTDYECRKKWGCLRDNFRKSMRKRITKSGQAATSNKPIKFEEILSFLIPYLGERNQSSNIVIEQAPAEINSDNEEVTDGTESELPSPNNCSSRGVTPTTPNSVSGSILGPKQRPHLATVLKNYFDKKTSQPPQTKDHLRKFFDAMEETVRTFDPSLQIEIKGKISSMVNEYEVKNFHLQQGNPSQASGSQGYQAARDFETPLRVDVQPSFSTNSHQVNVHQKHPGASNQVGKRRRFSSPTATTYSDTISEPAKSLFNYDTTNWDLNDSEECDMNIPKTYRKM